MLQANGTRSIEALAQLLADRHAELEAIHDRLDSLADTTDPAALEVQEAGCAAELVRAQQALEAARLGVTEANRRLAAADSAAAGVRGEQMAAAARVAELQERLAVERGQQTDEALAAAHRCGHGAPSRR